MGDVVGALIGGDELRRLLGYRTAEALRSAVRRGSIAVPVFRIQGRRGFFARRDLVAAWQATLASTKPPEDMPSE
jgi:hypothetical protein